MNSDQILGLVLILIPVVGGVIWMGKDGGWDFIFEVLFIMFVMVAVAGMIMSGIYLLLYGGS